MKPTDPVPPSNQLSPVRRMRVHAGYLGLILMLGAGIVTFDGVRRQSTGPAVIILSDPPAPPAPLSLSAPAAATATTMADSGGTATTNPARTPLSHVRVATFNMASGRGRDGVVDLRRTAETIRLAGELDVVGLHEVRGYFTGQPASQAGELAGMLTRSFAFAAAERRWWHEDFGNAVLLTRPAESVVLRMPLPQTQERGHRNVTVTRVRMAGNRMVTILATHVDRREDQPAQLRYLANLLVAVEEPAILLGDLNVVRSHPILRELVERHGVVDATAPFASVSSATQIEHILVRGLVPVAAGQTDIGGSDHPLIWAELGLP